MDILEKSTETEYEFIPFEDSKFPINVKWNKKLRQDDAENLDKPRWHEQIEIKYFIHGGAEITCNSNIFIAEAGDIVIINPCERHSIRVFNDESEYHLIMIDPNMLRSRETDILDIKYLIPFVESRVKFNNLIRNNNQIKNTLTSIIDELYNRNIAYEFMLKGLFLILFAQLFRHEVKEIIEAEYMKYMRQYSNRLDPAIEHILKHYHENISIGTLAELCGMSLFYFCRTFKNVSGMTPVEYVNNYRINKAEVLLRTTGLSVNSVSDKVGFRDECYFSRCFKQIKGYTPSSCRQ